MEKDFDGWNKLKKEIDIRNPIYVSERDVWFCSVGINVGSEQSGKSTIAASSIAASQRRGENVAIVSGMNGGVEEWLLDASGVDRSKLLITEFRKSL